MRCDGSAHYSIGQSMLRRPFPPSAPIVRGLCPFLLTALLWPAPPARALAGAAGEPDRPCRELRLRRTIESLKALEPAWRGGAPGGYVPRNVRRVPEVDSLENFDRVEQNLYRGHSPDLGRGASDRGVGLLRGLGVTDVVSLRTRTRSVDRERARCAEQGLRLHSIPLPSWDPGLPIPGMRVVDRERDVARAVALIDVLLERERVVYVHCSHGRDRTGLVIAMRRLMEGSSPEDVLRDAREHGMSFVQVGMRRFVKARTGATAMARFRALVEEERAGLRRDSGAVVTAPPSAPVRAGAVYFGASAITTSPGSLRGM